MPPGRSARGVSTREQRRLDPRCPGLVILTRGAQARCGQKQPIVGQAPGDQHVAQRQAALQGQRAGRVRSAVSVGQGVVVFARRGRFNPVRLVGPGAQVNAPAALAAKRPPWVVGCKNGRPPAGWAGDAAGAGHGRRGVGVHGVGHRPGGFAGRHRGSGIRPRRSDRVVQTHSVSSNGKSTGAGRSRPSASARTRRTVTIRRWPVISGTRPSASAMRRRSNW